MPNDYCYYYNEINKQKITPPTCSDLIIVYDSDIAASKFGIPRLKTTPEEFERLKKCGNDFFIKKSYDSALRCYMKALTIKEEKNVYLNCSAAYLGLKNYWRAHEFAKKSLSSEEAQTEKARFRMAKALYYMRQWKESIEQYEKCLKINSSNRQAQLELEKARKRFNESINGEKCFDLKDLFDRAFKKNESELDVADYVNEKLIEVKDCSKGKGVFAREDIKRGTLLVVSKAFSIGRKTNPRQVQVLINLIIKKRDDASGVDNLNKLVNNIQSNPYLAKEFYKLYAGPSLNRDESIADDLVDVNRMESIVAFNSFANENFFLASEMTNNDTGDVGVWIFPSYFNHSCITNSVRIFLGDVVFIFASKEINKDDEITTQYTSPFEDYLKRKKIFEFYSFVCKCDLCELDKSDPNCAVRKELIETSYSTWIKPNPDDLNAAKDLIGKLRKTFYNRTKYQFDLNRPLMHLAHCYYVNGKLDKHCKILMEFFELTRRESDSSRLHCFESLRNLQNNWKYPKGRRMLEKSKKCISHRLSD